MSNHRIEKCPLCNGSGSVKVKEPVDRDAHKEIAVLLRSKGYTLRQIMVMLGYDHPQSIAHLLKKKKSK